MIDFKGVKYTYFNEFYSLFDFSYKFDSGHYALIGAYEDGGLTVIRLLAKLDTFYKGNILINNVELKKVNFKKNFNVAYISAEPYFFNNKSVYDNMAYPLKSRKIKRDSREELIKNALSKFGLENLTNEKVKNLTYQQKLLLSIARANTRKLDLLLIEDVFDTISYDIIKNLAETVIVVSKSDNVPLYYTKLVFNLGNFKQEN